MKTTFVAALIAAASVFTFAPAMADTYVHGYTRGNGTYVAPHYRSSPDSSYNNNWSVQGNVNPYTGQQGTRAPHYADQAPGTASGSRLLYPYMNSASAYTPFSLDLD